MEKLKTSLAKLVPIQECIDLINSDYIPIWVNEGEEMPQITM
jgi:hypothetical protein